MDLPKVKAIIDKKQKKIDADSLFDFQFKEGGKVRMAKKKKKDKDPNKLDMSFYNIGGSKRYKKENR